MDVWVCSSCTAHNLPHSNVCFVCGLSNQRQKDTLLAPCTYWACTNCTAHNPLTAGTCELCGGHRRITHAPVTSGSSYPEISEVINVHSINPLQCRVCGKHHPSSALFCTQCGAARGTFASVAQLSAEVALQSKLDEEAARSFYRDERVASDFATAQLIAGEEAAHLLNDALRRDDDIARGEIAARILHNQHLEMLEATCVLCLGTERIKDMFTLDCPEAHRYCLECVKRQVCALIESILCP